MGLLGNYHCREQLGFFRFTEEVRLIEETLRQIVDGKKRAGSEGSHLLIDAGSIESLEVMIARDKSIRGMGVRLRP